MLLQKKKKHTNKAFCSGGKLHSRNHPLTVSPRRLNVLTLTHYLSPGVDSKCRSLKDIKTQQYMLCMSTNKTQN